MGSEAVLVVLCDLELLSRVRKNPRLSDDGASLLLPGHQAALYEFGSRLRQKKAVIRSPGVNMVKAIRLPLTIDSECPTQS